MVSLENPVFAVQILYFGKIWLLSKFRDLQVLTADVSEEFFFNSYCIQLFSCDKACERVSAWPMISPTLGMC